MGYTAIQDRSVITVATAKLFMRVDSNVEDSIVAIMLNAAKSRGDAYVNNPFKDKAGVELDIPYDVELWVLQTTSKFYNQRTIGIRKEEILELGSVQYEPNADVDVNFDLLKPYRLEVGFGGFFIS